MSGLTQEKFRGKKQTGAGCANKPHSEHHEHTYNCNGKICDINGNIRNTYSKKIPPTAYPDQIIPSEILISHNKSTGIGRKKIRLISSNIDFLLG